MRDPNGASSREVTPPGSSHALTLIGSTPYAAPASTTGDWTDRALCAEVDSDIFFPEKGESTSEAKSTCRACTVRAECLDYALTQGEQYGIWGGFTQDERRYLHREAAA